MSTKTLEPFDYFTSGMDSSVHTLENMRRSMMRVIEDAEASANRISDRNPQSRLADWYQGQADVLKTYVNMIDATLAELLK